MDLTRCLAILAMVEVLLPARMAVSATNAALAEAAYERDLTRVAILLDWWDINFTPGVNTGVLAQEPYSCQFAWSPPAQIDAERVTTLFVSSSQTHSRTVQPRVLPCLRQWIHVRHRGVVCKKSGTWLPR